MPSSLLLARNTFFNLFAQGCMLAVAFISTPILFHRLGPDAYGIVSIALVVTGYLSFVDLGIGAASVKFVAERLAAQAYDDVARLVSTALVSNALLGLIGTGLLWVWTPSLVNHVLRVSPALRPQASSALMLMATGLPLVFVSAVFEGTLTTVQRFDVLNVARMGIGVLKAGIAVALVLAGFGAPGAVFATVVVQALQCLVMSVLALRLVPDLRLTFRWTRNEFRKLLGFGSWVTVSSLVAPFFIYLDRFFLGALASMSAVGYYSVPYDAVTKLLIIPAAVSPVLFPMFATLHSGSFDRGKLTKLYSQSVQYVFVTIVPIVAVIVFFAPQILHFWMGDEVALHSSQVMRILAVGVLGKSIAQIPYGLVQASGRPDLTAKFHLGEVLPYAALCVWLFPTGGALAAALVWSLRVFVDGALLVVVASRIIRISFRASFQRIFSKWALLLTGGFGFSIAIIWGLGWSPAESAYFVSIISGVYVIAVWRQLVLHRSAGLTDAGGYRA